MDRHQENRATAVPHQLILQDRSHLELSGVTDVESFDDTAVNCCTPLGKLMVSGSHLQVQRLDLDGTALSIEGQIDVLQYTDVRKGGLLGRLFR